MMNGKDARPSLQLADVKQAHRLLNELEDAKLLGKNKRRTPGTFERSLLAGHAAAIAPVGANGEVAYAAAMKPWGLTLKDTAPVRDWTLRFKKLFESREKNAEVRTETEKRRGAH